MANKKSKPNAATDRPSTFEESLADLEQIVTELESGKLGLSESLARYEEGVRRLRDCHAELEGAQRRIEVLSGVDAQGRPTTLPLADDDETLEQKQAKRSARRSGRSDLPPEGQGVDELRRLF